MFQSKLEIYLKKIHSFKATKIRAWLMSKKNVLPWGLIILYLMKIL